MYSTGKTVKPALETSIAAQQLTCIPRAALQLQNRIANCIGFLCCLSRWVQALKFVHLRFRTRNLQKAIELREEQYLRGFVVA